MISLVAEAPMAFLSPPIITMDALNAGAVVSNDTLISSLAYRPLQLDPTQQVIAATAPAGSPPTYANPITYTAGLYKGSIQTVYAADTFFLLNTNIKNFKIQYCEDYNYSTQSGTWQTAVDQSTGAGLAAADGIFPIMAPVNCNGIRLIVYSTQDGNSAALGVFNGALLLFQPSRGFTKHKPMPKQNRREVVLADGTPDCTPLNWSDNSCNLFNPSLQFDLMLAADVAGIEPILFGPDAFLVFLEPAYFPRRMYLCELKLDSYSGAEYVSTWKGAGYTFTFILQQVGFR